MKNIIEIQRTLLPDLLDVMQKRYHILQYIRLMGPIGRRSLSTSLSMSERVLRSEVDFLKNQNLLHANSIGMSVTQEGLVLLEQLEDIMKEAMGLRELENLLKEKLGLKEVIVVAGDSDSSEWVKKELGRACAVSIKSRLGGKNIVAVTGGTTMASAAEMMTPDVENREILFVPARGGLGERVENQANSVCAKFAERAGADYLLLHVPDQLSNEAYLSIIEEPPVKEVHTLIKSSTMVVHGIGDAETMAERRKVSADNMRKIMDAGAVAEAFGYYYNREGNVVHRIQTIGIQLENLENINHVIAVAGGASKATAIKAYMKQAHDSLLITDEGAAKALLQGM